MRIERNNEIGNFKFVELSNTGRGNDLALSFSPWRVWKDDGEMCVYLEAYFTLREKAEAINISGCWREATQSVVDCGALL